MEDSFTLTLSGTSSVLEAGYFPPIELSPYKNYALGLIELLTFNSIPNVDTDHNKLYVGDEVITIPTGSYEIEDIENYVHSALTDKSIVIQIKPNNNTLCSEIKCKRDVDFRPNDSIGRLLSFTQGVLKANKLHTSDVPVAILKVNALRVECNVTTGAYINERKVHTIHEFFPVVPPGYKIIEVPSHVIYLPIATKTIDHLQLRIVDQDGDLVNFQGEVITIRLHVRSMR
ncbi:uncharacterized protein LOC112495015 isoform X1 [Cephus cinctus]|uniref:Uncharacterized protein LOC112495015 isoform X1 n=1 Tax=Cephus cinctus TaxID=211228 RepID=A0AAJ7W5K4_CEPCN|nr:uncharacterized protein LOC112495015 isoform X1 [Cephus cinctus]